MGEKRVQGDLVEVVVGVSRTISSLLEKLKKSPGGREIWGKWGSEPPSFPFLLSLVGRR